jgi:hypothetical protein
MQRHSHRLTPTGLSPSPAPPSKGLQLQRRFLTVRKAGRPSHALPQPHTHNPCRVSRMRGLASSDFARHYSRNHCCFLFLPVLRCFTSRRSLHTPYFIQARVTGHDSSWVSPFGHPRITARLPTPQGLSQAPTSFIGSRCQGIHRVPFTACHHQHHTTPVHPHHPTQGAADAPQAQHGHVDGSTLQRCSRPLSRSQTTTPHHPHTQNNPCARCGREPETPGTPTSHPHHHTPTTL